MQHSGNRTRATGRLSDAALQERLDHELAALEALSDSRQTELLRQLAAHLVELEERNRALQARATNARVPRAQQEHLFAELPIGYALLDRQGRMRELNARSARILGRALEELKGRHLGALLEANQNGVLVQHLRKVFGAPAEAVVDEVEARTPRGPVWLRLESTLVHPEANGEARCRTAMLDITAQRCAELQLQDHRRLLVRAARMTLLGEMASTLAHDLSQPLSALSLYVSVAGVRCQTVGAEQDECRALLRKSQRQIQRATATVRRVRRFARVGEAARARHDLAVLTGRVLSYLEPEIRQCGARVRLRGPRVAVLGDRYQLEQVLLSLVRNAVDSIRRGFVASGSIEISLVQHDHGVVEVCVADNGVGLPEDPRQLDALFAPLGSGKPEAAGLGLPVSRSLIAAHGGRLWAEPNRPRGARFVFTLPVAILPRD